ncbi:MAG: D-alanyl-D-alanine carboxypeptidase [Clostridia bacterium]|nr:D-alanyl-D-alanine carboxypeptidase [Clostridia bacterium]
MRKALILCMLIASTAVFVTCRPAEVYEGSSIVENKQQVQDDVKEEETKETETKEVETKEIETKEVFAQSFAYYPIDEKIESRIMGVSWKQGSPVALKDLRYVNVFYWGFDEQPHIGELIVNKAVAKDIVEIFEELYEAKFPIAKISLIDEYNAEDSKSMEDNNTSAFCYREVDGKPGQLSKHSYGVAIDINPIQNPYVYKDKVSPSEGKSYLDRSEMSKGMIVKDDLCYKAFTSRGWTWGGDWKYEKDYQHFQKQLK